MVKAIWIAVLTAAWLIPGSVRAQTDEGLATAESRVLAAYMEAEFGPFIRDYIHVFLGYQACAYSFVDEEAYNKLADQQLLKMSQRAQEQELALLRETVAASPTLVWRTDAKGEVVWEYLDPNNKTPCRVLLFYYEALCNCIIDAVLCQEGRYPKPRAVREFLHELHHYHGVL